MVPAPRSPPMIFTAPLFDLESVTKRIMGRVAWELEASRVGQQITGVLHRSMQRRRNPQWLRQRLEALKQFIRRPNVVRRDLEREIGVMPTAVARIMFRPAKKGRLTWTSDMISLDPAIVQFVEGIRWVEESGAASPYLITRAGPVSSKMVMEWIIGALLNRPLVFGIGKTVYTGAIEDAIEAAINRETFRPPKPQKVSVEEAVKAGIQTIRSGPYFAA